MIRKIFAIEDDILGGASVEEVRATAEGLKRHGLYKLPFDIGTHVRISASQFDDLTDPEHKERETSKYWRRKEKFFRKMSKTLEIVDATPEETAQRRARTAETADKCGAMAKQIDERNERKASEPPPPQRSLYDGATYYYEICLDDLEKVLASAPQGFEIEKDCTFCYRVTHFPKPNRVEMMSLHAEGVLYKKNRYARLSPEALKDEIEEDIADGVSDYSQLLKTGDVRHPVGHIEISAADALRDILIVTLRSKGVIKTVVDTNKRARLLRKGDWKNEDGDIITYLSLAPRETSDYKGGTHASPRLHLRRGHDKSQHFGPGMAQTKQIWIDAVWVNEDAPFEVRRTAYKFSKPKREKKEDETKREKEDA